MTLEETKKAGNICNRDEPCENCPLYDDKICIEHLAENAVRHLEELEQRIPRWISVEERLPEQTPSLFSKYKDTDRWSKAMWVMDSETVLVTVVAKGESIVTTGKLQDGKWCTRISPVIEYKVTHWMPLPEIPKEVSE